MISIIVIKAKKYFLQVATACIVYQKTNEAKLLHPLRVNVAAAASLSLS